MWLIRELSSVKKKNRGGKRKGKINKLNPHVSKVRKYIDII